jgi:ElaB/YqjD/DUF883 family membrane-anchored ribosome-binding protein
MPLEAHAVHTGGDAGETAAKTGRRHARKPAGPKSARKTSAESDTSAPDDSSERLREQAAEIIAATRERIVEKPLQAVLVAAAAGAFVALLLGAARR